MTFIASRIGSTRRSGFAVLWAMLALPLAVDLAWLWGSSVDLSWSGTARSGLLILATSWAAQAAGKWQWPRISAMLHAFVLLAAITFTTQLMAYLAAARAAPLADAALLCLDALWGLDVARIAAWAEARPALASLLDAAYQLFVTQITLAPLVLGWALKDRRLQVCLHAYLGSLVVIAACSAFAPALGYYLHLGLDPHAFGNLRPSFAFDFRDHADALRSVAPFVFDPRAQRGILTFPSFHACAAVLLIYAWAGLPRLLSRPLLVLNLGMIASAVTNGGHYVVDVVAGVLLGLAALAVSARRQGRVAGGVSLLWSRWSPIHRGLIHRGLIHRGLQVGDSPSRS